MFEISEQFIEHRVLPAGGLSTESIVEVDNRFSFVQSIKQCQHCVINVNTNTTFLSAASNINILVFPLYFDFL